MRLKENAVPGLVLHVHFTPKSRDLSDSLQPGLRHGPRAHAGALMRSSLRRTIPHGSTSANARSNRRPANEDCRPGRRLSRIFTTDHRALGILYLLARAGGGLCRHDAVAHDARRIASGRALMVPFLGLVKPEEYLAWSPCTAR